MVIPPSQVRNIRQKAGEVLASAFDLSYEHSVDQWLDRCEKDLAQLWTDGSYFILTEVSDSKAERIIKLVASAGSFSQRLHDEVEMWARAVGCKKCVFTGRRGWVRRFRDYKCKAVTLEKEL